MKEEVVALKHLETVRSNLVRCKNLLNDGKDVYPFYEWIDGMNNIIQNIEEYIAGEKE